MPGAMGPQMAPEEIQFGDDGLVPCVTQDADTGEVLTLAWMNREALDLTVSTGEVHFFSRSRNELWHKGATSGNTQKVVDLRLDCDGDAILALVRPAGPACHTGERSCFHRGLGEGGEPTPTSSEALAILTRTIASRADEMPEGSYTTSLLADASLAGDKVIEEAAEVVEAIDSESDERVAEETADLLYHLAVLVQTRGVGLDRAMEVLNGRRT